MRATSELTEICLGVLMCPDVEFSFFLLLLTVL